MSEQKVYAPIFVGDTVGKLTVYVDGIAVGEIDAVSNEDVNKKNYCDYIKDVIDGWKLK